MIREHRYFVIKLKDLNAALTTTEIGLLNQLAVKVHKYRVTHQKSPLECVVVESDWPEYEPTWKAIESRVERIQQDEAEVIAHQIYCHAGECGGNPSCFYALSEWKRQVWVEAVRTVLTCHGFQFKNEVPNT